MKQTAVEYLIEQIKKDSNLRLRGFDIDGIGKQAKEMEKQQQLELIQFLAEREDFKEHFSMSIFIAEDFLNQFKNK